MSKFCAENNCLKNWLLSCVSEGEDQEYIDIFVEFINFSYHLLWMRESYHNFTVTQNKRKIINANNKRVINFHFSRIRRILITRKVWQTIKAIINCMKSSFNWRFIPRSYKLIDQLFTQHLDIFVYKIIIC